MKISFLDFETTGLPEYQKPSHDDCQPYITSMAIHTIDKDMDNGKIVNRIYGLVQTPRESEPEALETHGLAKEYLDKVGMTPTQAAQMLYIATKGSDLIVAHNCAFDRRIARIAFARYISRDAADTWKEIPYYCTMVQYRRYANLRKFDKGASLEAVSQNFLSLPPSRGHHNSYTDMHRCQMVFKKLCELGQTPDGWTYE